MCKKLFFLTTAFFLILFFFPVAKIWADSTCPTSDNDPCAAKSAEDKVSCYENLSSTCSKEIDSLSSQIQTFNSNIALTNLRINQTEQQIDKLTGEIASISGKIDNLESSLTTLSNVFIERIIASYKNSSHNNLGLLLFSSNKLYDLLVNLRYLQIVQRNDQKILLIVETTKINYTEQKKIREQKKIELVSLKSILDKQKVSLNYQKALKQKFLEETQNDERVYQQLLKQARAEYLAIQGIIAGGGTETKLREVTKGETIAYVISGSSCNSSGSHLHFMVQDGGNIVNPLSYLKSVDYENCSGSYCGSGDGDSINPSGSFDWPLRPRIKVNQGYGSTWAVRNTWVGKIYSFHNGVDISGSSNSVVAVADGTLYKGSYSVGCILSYVKLAHKDSNIATYYLHAYSN